MIKHDKVELEIRGQKEIYKSIGMGATTYAFIKPEDPATVFAIVPDLKFKDGTSLEDTAKDVLAKAYEKNKENPYLPKVEFVGREFVDGPEMNRPCKIYKMPFYRDLEDTDKAAWLEMKKLHKVRDDALHDLYDVYQNATGKKGSMTFLGNKAMKHACVIAKEKLNVLLVSALMSIFESLPEGHPGLMYEFNKKNVGIDGQTGHLILRDPVYDSEISVKIQEDRE
jgi:hypothetical protein